MDTKKRCAIWRRVSTGEQTNANQLPDLVRLARARGYEIVATYEEVGSAAAKERPTFSKMRLEAHRGEFEVLVTTALDRLGRSMVGNLQAVLELDKLNVKVVSLRESWLDLDGPVRPLLIAIFGWVAEQERLQIVARTKAGMERARREGKQIGRPPVDVDLPRALALRDRGLSIRKMARELGIGASTLHRALQVHDALEPRVPEGGYLVQVTDPQDRAGFLGMPGE